MKAYLHKLIGTAVLVLALCSSSLPVWAGAVSLPQVSVGTYGAGGSMAGARYSADSQQYIGCRFANTSGPYVICSATDSAGNSLYCFGYEARYLAAAKAITDFSNISFGVAPGSAYCTRLAVDNYSYHLR
jgi:hypothetical protein